MADVDFSNATMQPYSNYAPMTYSEYLAFYRSAPLYNSSGSGITSNYARTIVSDTASMFSYLFTGTFTASGTEFYIGWSSSALVWKVSNISFSAGDNYSFIVDIEVEGNT